MLHRLCAFLLATALVAVSPAAAPPASTPAAALDALAAQYWQREQQNDYYVREELGLPIETIRALTYENAADDAASAGQLLASLGRIDSHALDHDRWLTYRTLQFLATNDVAGKTYYWLRQQATPYAGGLQISQLTGVLAGMPIASAADAQRYVALLHQYAVFLTSIDTLLHGQHDRGIILPNVETDAALAVFRGYDVPAASSPFVLNHARLNAIPAADRAAIQADAAKVIASEIVPAYDAIVAYLAGPYRTGAPSGVGLAEYPGGRAYYQYLIFANTTLTTTPEALHASGLREVAKLNAQIDAIRKQVGFTGNLAAFKHYLATDKRFFPATTQAFGDRLEVFVQRSAAAAPKYFSKMPKAPYGVEALPKALAGSQTFGYYDPATPARPKGRYLYNAWHPERTSLLGAGALICHELIPGHHFQIALQQENTALPPVRHYDFSETGYVEGWGEYSSQLCWQMGVYQTPYDKLGRLMQDLLVSTRLVVDTGMNAMGWSRQRAMQYMHSNLILSDGQIATESLRYSTDIPGQALAYKTGELTMLALRARAQSALGKNFDIRTFHGWVINSGSMTLDTLSEHIDYEIARQKKPST
ncbi:MAG: DUF885 domain-containing protein [Candidatus Aquilonibacter sp.]